MSIARFPLWLSFALTVPLELYYVVPLHTAGFLITAATCKFAFCLEERFGLGYWSSRWGAVLACLLAHVAFYETPLVDTLKLFSYEYHFRSARTADAENDCGVR